MSTSNPRIHYRQEIYVGHNGEAFVTCSGELGQRVARLLGPTPDQTRQMLRELRAHLKCSVAGLGVCLGVPRITVRRWLDGSRRPTGAARRLVHLLHSIIVAKVTKIDFLDVGHWTGASPLTESRPNMNI